MSVRSVLKRSTVFSFGRNWMRTGDTSDYDNKFSSSDAGKYETTPWQ